MVRFNSATAVTPWVTRSPRPSPATPAARFNSATAVTPWVTPPKMPSKMSVLKLQFGHGGDAVGDEDAARVLNSLIEASIRPRR